MILLWALAARIVHGWPGKAGLHQIDEVIRSYNEAIHPAQVDPAAVILTMSMEASWMIVLVGAEGLVRKTPQRHRSIATNCVHCLLHFAPECLQLMQQVILQQ